MDFELDGKTKERVDHFKEFCRAEIRPRASPLDEVPAAERILYLKKNLSGLGRQGYFHCLLEESLLHKCLLGEHLAWACGATFLAAAASGVAFGYPLKRFGTAGQKERYAGRLASGEGTGCLACTEAQAGSDLGGLGTKAQKKGTGFLISGEKDLVTNAPLADWFLVLAWTDEACGLASGLTFFVIDRSAPGLAVGEPVETMGLKGAVTAPVALNEVFVTEEAVLGGRIGQGYGQLGETLEEMKLALSALALGLGTACLEAATRQAKTRLAFGKPIGLFEGVGAKLAVMFTLLDLGRMLTCYAAFCRENGEENAPSLASSAKLFTGEAAREIAHLALQIHGGHGYLKGHPVERLYRDAKFCEVAYGTSEMLRAAIARDILKKYQTG